MTKNSRDSCGEDRDDPEAAMKVNFDDVDDEPSVLGAGGGPAPMPSKAEAEAAWRQVYADRLVQLGVDRESAQAAAEAADVNLSENLAIPPRTTWSIGTRTMTSLCREDDPEARMTDEQKQEIVTTHAEAITRVAVEITFVRAHALVDRYAQEYKQGQPVPQLLISFPSPKEKQALAALVVAVAIAERRRLRTALFRRLADDKTKTTRTAIYDELKRDVFADIE